MRSLLILILGAQCLMWAEEPWNIDPATREALNREIQAKCEERALQASKEGPSYCIDGFVQRMNFSKQECPYCQEHGLEQRLYEAGFKKIETIQSHYAGIAILFARYLLNQTLDRSCEEMLYDFQNQYLSVYEAHEIAKNQIMHYRDQQGKVVWFSENAAKEFFEIVIGEAPTHYHFLHPEAANPLEFDTAAIYTTLTQLPYRVILVGYQTKDGHGHMITVCTDPHQLLIFEPNKGLLQFRDLETMSGLAGKTIGHSQLDFIVAFPSQLYYYLFHKQPTALE